MNPTSSLRCRWVRHVLMIGDLALIAAIFLAGARGEEAKGDANKAAGMVEAIVNRNKPPEIVKRQRVKPSRLPLYPKDYDWREEDRVRKALEDLRQDTSDEVWEALVRKSNDRRYCIASYSFSSSDVEMHSVGRVCYGLAYRRLCRVFMKHLPSYPPHGSPIQMWDVIKDFPTWRKDRKDKALYELQIEVCEIALRELAKLKDEDLSEKGKAEARKKILAEIAELRRSKEPLMEAGGIPRPYPRREAERVREAHAKGTLEEFRSGLNR